MIKVLMIDDKPNVWHSIRQQANENGIELHYAKAEDSGIDYLKSTPSIQGVIIDGIGLKRESQPENSETSTHALSVITLIEAWERETNRETRLAKCIFTASPTTFKSFIDRDDIPIFGKNEVPDEKITMFEYLKTVIRESFSYKFRGENKLIFYAIKSDFFLENKHLKNYFNKSLHHTEALDLLFLDLAKYLSEPVYDKKFFSVCRDILEYFFISLRGVALPDQLFKNDNSPNQQMCVEFIIDGETYNRQKPHPRIKATQKEKSYFDDPTRYSFQYLKYITNDFSHPQIELYSKYLLESTVNCFFSLLLWLAHKKDIGKQVSKSLSQQSSTALNVFAQNDSYVGSTKSETRIETEVLLSNDSKTSYPATHNLGNLPQKTIDQIANSQLAINIRPEYLESESQVLNNNFPQNSKRTRVFKWVKQWFGRKLLS